MDIDQIRQKLTQSFKDAKVFQDFFDEIFEELKDDIKMTEVSIPEFPHTISRFRALPLNPEQNLNYRFNKIFEEKLRKYNPNYDNSMPNIVKDFNNKEIIKFEFYIFNNIKIHMWRGYTTVLYKLFDYTLRVNPNLIIDGAFLSEDFPLSKDINSWTNQDLVMLRLMS